MFVGYAATRRQRRGVVLILILAMLALLALIGVTFATFSGQAKVNARNFSMAQNTPESPELMDYALSQLIEDTANPMSAIRGHSLARDMYGNDAYFNGALTGRPYTGQAMSITSAAVVPAAAMGGNNVVNGIDTTGLYKCVTNIQTSDQAFAGFNFARWILRINAATAGTFYQVATSYEIIVDDSTSAANRIFYLAPPDALTNSPITGNAYVQTIPDPTDPAPLYGPITPPANAPPTYKSPDSGTTQSGLHVSVTTNGMGAPNTVTPPLAQFVLDGRYLHAFNGAGIGSLGNDSFPNLPGPPPAEPGGAHSLAQYANFRFNRNIFNPNPPFLPAPGDPDQIGVGMDEDYDACDLENWFLAIQSGDGKTIIPSFHRPGILNASDWSVTYNTSDPDYYNAMNPTTAYHLNETRALSKILRPRAIDHNNNQLSFPDLTPNAGGQISYDVDNDGNGAPDSVWLDLGYPVKRNSDGQLYKPLFAFMVVGLNGRIPLNTAGNLQLRDVSGNPLFAHASHLGNSPSELDPTYALQDGRTGGASGSVAEQGDNVGVPVSLTQLRNVLAGTYPQKPTSVQGGVTPSNGDSNYVTIGGNSYYLPNNMTDAGDLNGASLAIYPDGGGVQPVAGRWGEAGSIDAIPGQNPPHILPAQPMGSGPIYANAVRAGLSQLYNSATSYGDARDDNFTTFDAFPRGTAGNFYSESPTAGPPRTNKTLPADYLDASGSMVLPVERYRRFVTPFDASGDGLIGPFNRPTSPLGPDLYGRVAYSKYFRPPGVPVATAGGGIGYPPTSNPAVDLTNNLLHGYEANRVPTNGNATDPRLVAGMPYEPYAATGPPTSLPTFTNATNSNLAQFGNPDYSPSLDEADEMNLYASDPHDAPFGPGDLEWLYRVQDTDGSSLSSRLQQLAPISLFYSGDAQRRRRLFSVDSWEPTTFAWTNDNPVDPTTGNPKFAGNSRFAQGANGGFATLTGPPPATTPSLAHRDRKINLNFPLPVSNNPTEPIRQKWIRETYQMLKAVLPPKAVDTPQELANLSQFVVNVIDFRDPDCTATRFVNTDVVVTPATATTQPKLNLNARGLTWQPPPPAVQGGALAAGPPAYSPEYTTLNSADPNSVPAGQYYLVQFGMEYSPVAINEVLAYQYQTKRLAAPDQKTSHPNGNDAKRMFVELVNTLVKDNSTTTASNLDLSGWDLVIMKDDGLGRPDPYSGQIPVQPAANILAVGLDGTAVKPATPTPTGPLTVPIPALQNLSASANNLANAPMTGPDVQVHAAGMPITPGYFYVIGNPPPATNAGNADVNAPPLDATVDLVANTLLNGETLAANKYYWLYLRRPANPFDAAYTVGAGTSYNPFESRVVVDAFRFMVNVTNAYGDTSMGTDTVTPKPSPDPSSPTAPVVGTPPTASFAGSNEFFTSLQRLQPYRGGHAVPPLSGDPAGSASYVNTAYGYTEQVQPATLSATQKTYYQYPPPKMPPVTFGTPPNFYGMYGTAYSTPEIFHSLGRPNLVQPTTPAGATPRVDNAWDLVPVHDRDFTSLAELLLVPGCPPGLFTKQFLEIGVPIPGTLTPRPQATAKPIATNPTTYYSTVSTTLLIDPGEPPRTYPYLVDHFYYTGMNPPAAAWPAPSGAGPQPVDPGTGNQIGGPTGAGWFKMLEFLEVPSTANGAIGPVANGLNYDWMRQDLRPGLLNLNLIIDEEVFFALMSETSLGQAANADPNYANFGNSRLNVAQGGTVPDIVTQVADVTAAVPGIPTAKYSMSDHGFTALDPKQSNNNMSATYDNKMKAAFADFLMLRHGGSKHLFAFGNGVTQSAGSPAAERPFHSLSYPDINLTVMRPAWLPPSANTTPAASNANPATPCTQPNSAPVNTWQDDPGNKNPWYYLANNPVQPEPIPPRRLFQVPDADPKSNASRAANNANSVSTVVPSPALNNNNCDLTPVPVLASAMPTPTAPDFAYGSTIVQGGHMDTANGVYDLRQSPYFRTEWLQKVTNLTTVRTHQYAVWITVGFFEVLSEGDPMLANSANWGQAYDTLGNEIGLLQGRNIRYRSFFIVDRTKLTGFNPLAPGNFRDCVLYRSAIE